MKPEPLPREGLLDEKGFLKRRWREYLEKVTHTIAEIKTSFPWKNLDFKGSKLSDIETRPHSELQGIQGADVTDDDATQDKHISNAQAKMFSDPVYQIGDRFFHLRPRIEINPADNSEYILTEWEEIL